VSREDISLTDGVTDQEANFNYITGAHNVPSCSVLIKFSPGGELEHTLFIPPADPLETMWSVAPPTIEEATERYDPVIKSTSDLDAALSALSGATLHTMPVTTEFPPLPASVTALTAGNHRADLLRHAFHLARMVKTEGEIELIRRANAITSGAHEVLMRELGRFAAQRNKTVNAATKDRTGHESMLQWEVESEADAEALFVAACRRMGAEQAYLPIVASGSHASTLHYV
jgi:Xaa-Pro dipeptidase